MGRWPDRTLGERFWEKVDRSGGPEGCWPFTGFRDRCGYGRISVGGRMASAHRLAWELTHGPIPPETPHVLHNCPGGDNPACVRHLWLGTNADNVRDKVAKGRQARGEQSAGATLNEVVVLEIRRVHADEGLGSRRLSRRFDVGKSTIQAILAGRTWGWLKESA